MLLPVREDPLGQDRSRPRRDIRPGENFEPSHGGLISEKHGLAAFAQAHGLTSPPATLVEQARELEDTLTHFRDREITHALIYGGRGVLYSPTGEVDVVRRGRPDPGAEGSRPHLIADLLPMVDTYLAGITGWVEQCLTDLAGLRLGAE